IFLRAAQCGESRAALRAAPPLGFAAMLRKTSGRSSSVLTSRKKIVLYSPQLADETRGYPSGKEVLPMPLLAIAAWPLADGYDVVVVDGSLYPQEEAHRRVLEHCEGALLYGTTGILGWQVSDG